MILPLMSTFFAVLIIQSIQTNMNLVIDPLDHSAGGTTRAQSLALKSKEKGKVTNMFIWIIGK